MKYKIKKITFLGMWNSREMMKNTDDQQLFVKVTLRELIIYCGFMFIICYGKYHFIVIGRIYTIRFL